MPDVIDARPKRVRWQVLAAAGILAVLAIRALVIPLFVVKMRGYPIDFFIGEGDWLVYTIRQVRGETLYSDSRAFPLLGNVYPPVFMWIAGAAGRIVTPTLASARVFGLIPLAGIMIVAALYLHRAGARAAIVAGAVLLIPCCYSMSHFLIMARCDSWMVLFCLCSLYFLDGENESPRRSLRWIMGGLCSSLALFTKQTSLFGVALIHLTLLLKRRRAGAWALAAAAAGCFILLGLALWCYGSTFIQAVTSLTARREFSAQRYMQFVKPLLGIGVLAAGAAVRMAIHLRRRQWDLLDSFVAGHALQTPLVFYLFSGSNYFLPFFVGVVLSSALLLDEFIKSTRSAGAAIGLCATLLAAQLWLQLPYESTVTPPDAAGFAEAQYAAAFLTETSEPVYPERFWGCVAGREATMQYFVEPTHLRTLPPGRISLETLTAPFRQKIFHRIMLFAANPFNPDKFLDDVMPNYRKVRIGYVTVCFGDTQSIPVVYLERK